MIARGALDIAVHSAKDLPVGVAWDNFFCLPRADARDVLLAVRGRGVQTIGTGSPRRAAAMARVCPGATVLPVRGNVDTRIRKMLRGEYDALVLAAAGLQRLGFYDERIAVRPLSVEECVPAACQGIIAIEGAVGAIIDDAPTARAARIERTCQRALEGDCTGGVGVYFDGETLYAQREGVIASVRYANENSIGDLIFRLGKRRET